MNDASKKILTQIDRSCFYMNLEDLLLLGYLSKQTDKDSKCMKDILIQQMFVGAWNTKHEENQDGED